MKYTVKFYSLKGMKLYQFAGYFEAFTQYKLCLDTALHLAFASLQLCENDVPVLDFKRVSTI